MDFLLDSTMAFLVGVTVLVTSANWWETRRRKTGTSEGRRQRAA
jgi:hypothetical protein